MPMKRASGFSSTLTICLLPVILFQGAQSCFAAQYTVEMTDNWTFSPSYLEIQVGDIVTWVNHDWTYNYHDSYCPGYWYVGPLDLDESGSLMFPITGTFNYRDSYWYVLGMRGTIVVNPATPTQPTPATLLDPTPLPGGGFQFTLSNLVVGATYVVQASTNLVDWSSLATNMAASSVETYVDNGAGAFTRRFYRSWHLP
jgi:plastocyanin